MHEELDDPGRPSLVSDAAGVVARVLGDRAGDPELSSAHPDATSLAAAEVEGDIVFPPGEWVDMRDALGQTRTDQRGVVVHTHVDGFVVLDVDSCNASKASARVDGLRRRESGLIYDVTIRQEDKRVTLPLGYVRADVHN